MTWRAANSLLVLHRQLQAGAPEAAPPATPVDAWGLIGDAAHDPASDHTPHDFPGWGNDIVTAADFPNRPDLGLDAHRVLDDIRAACDLRVKYGISNDQIFSSYATSARAAWTWGPYDPGDPNRNRHYDHGHLSVVGNSSADGAQPWPTIGAPIEATGEDDDMGASFGPITINVEGVTSLSLPETNGGGADPRPAWLRVCNDTGGRPGQTAAPDYALRIMGVNMGGTWMVLLNTPGLVKFRSGRVQSFKIPDGVTGLSITRAAIDPDTGAVIDPSRPSDSDAAPYPDHLTCCIERGPTS